MRRLGRCLRGISPVLAVLMMIAVAIAGALVTYAWVMGYIGFQTQKSGETIQINSVTNDGDDLLVYVQNVGEGVVQLDEESCLYVDGRLVPCTITNVSVTGGLATLGLGDTAQLRYAGGAAYPGERLPVKVTTTNGTPAELDGYPAGTVRVPSVLDHFEFSYVLSPQAVDVPFAVTIRALDQYDDLFTAYNGVNTLTYSSGDISPSATGNFLGGIWTGEVTVTGSATAATITTVSQSNPSCTGISNTFVTLAKPIPAMWNKTYGGEDYDRAWSVIQTTDGGYALSGESNYAFCLVKTSPDGTMEWNRTFWDVSNIAYSVIQTSDGGYAIAGDGNSDFMLFKLAPDGTTEWNQTYDGEYSDVARAVIQTSDGGYVMAGRTNFGGGTWDFWLVKLNENGVREWDRTYGGSGSDLAYAVVETSDGYAIAGYTTSYGAGSDDCWLIKTNKNGAMQWNRTYGGADDDCAFALVTTSDGGFALAGSTKSFGAGHCNFWLIKTDADGYEEWNWAYGGPETDDQAVATALVVTHDGGFAIGGYSDSLNGSGGLYDFWLVKTDASGHYEWNQTYAGASINYAQALVATTDGGYALAGNIMAPNSNSNYDFWLVKTNEYGDTQ